MVDFVRRMDDDGIPIQHIPLTVLQQLALHLDVGTEHTWSTLAEHMGLNAVTISVSYFCSLVCCAVYLPLSVF